MAKKTTKKKAPAKPKLKKLEFNESVQPGKSVTIESEHYTVMDGKKLKSKTSGEVFSY